MSLPYTPSAYGTFQTQIGLAVETTRGTPEAPTLWLPVKAPKYEPTITMIADESLQGSSVQVYDEVRGQRYDGHGWDGYAYGDTFPALVRALLGSSDTLTAAPASTTLSSSAVQGATSVSTTATVAAGSWVSIGSASSGTLETHLVSAVTGAGPYSLTLATPLAYNQANGAAVTGLTKHQFSLLNNSSQGDQPPSYTITDFDGDQWRQLPMCQLDKLTIKGTGQGLVEYTVSWFGNPAQTPTTPTSSFTSTQAPPGWSSQIIIGGTQAYHLQDWEFDFSRQVKAIPALTGNISYYMYFAGPLTCTGKFTAVEHSGAPELTAFENNTQQMMDFTWFDTQSGYAVNVHSSKTRYMKGSLNRGKEMVEADMEFVCLPTATDALAGGVSPVLVTAANATATAY